MPKNSSKFEKRKPEKFWGDFSLGMHKNAKLLPACQIVRIRCSRLSRVLLNRTLMKVMKTATSCSPNTVIKEYNSVIQTCSHQRHQTS